MLQFNCCNVKEDQSFLFVYWHKRVRGKVDRNLGMGEHGSWLRRGADLVDHPLDVSDNP